MVDIQDADEGIRIAAVSGDMPLDAAHRLVLDALVRAQDEGIKRFVIDVTEAKALGTPHVATRLGVVRAWASAARPGLSLAFVGPESIMDRERVGLVVARGMGMNIDVFATRSDAIAWLGRQGVGDGR